MEASVINSTSFLARMKSWSRAELMSPFIVGGNCCTRELARLSGPNPQAANIREDLIDNKAAGSCDVLIVSGVINEKSQAYLSELYESLMEPRYVMAVGMCTASGALFETIPLDSFLPVDIYIGGCPPTLESLIAGIEKMRSMVRRGEGQREIHAQA